MSCCGYDRSLDHCHGPFALPRQVRSIAEIPSGAHCHRCGARHWGNTRLSADSRFLDDSPRALGSLFRFGARPARPPARNRISWPAHQAPLAAFVASACHRGKAPYLPERRGTLPQIAAGLLAIASLRRRCNAHQPRSPCELHTIGTLIAYSLSRGTISGEGEMLYAVLAICVGVAFFLALDWAMKKRRRRLDRRTMRKARKEL